MEKLYVVYDSLQKYNLIYSLQFDFWHHYSTSYALLNPAESIVKGLDEENFTYGIYADLQKVLATVDHNILTRSLSSKRNISS